MRKRAVCFLLRPRAFAVGAARFKAFAAAAADSDKGCLACFAAALSYMACQVMVEASESQQRGWLQQWHGPAAFC